MPPQEAIAARMGDVVTVSVPSWDAAGFVWSANFDRSTLKAIGNETTGTNDMAARRDTLFRFELLARQARLQLVLSRPGQSPQQTRDYLVGQSGAD